MWGILAYILDTKVSTSKPEEVPIVCDYLDVLLEELPSLPLKREIEFSIEVALGKTPISISPYWMVRMSWRILTLSCKNYLIEVSSNLVCHRGVLRFFLSRKTMEHWDSALIIDSRINLQSRIGTHSFEYMICLINFRLLACFQRVIYSWGTTNSKLKN